MMWVISLAILLFYSTTYYASYSESDSDKEMEYYTDCDNNDMYVLSNEKLFFDAIVEDDLDTVKYLLDTFNKNSCIFQTAYVAAKSDEMRKLLDQAGSDAISAYLSKTGEQWSDNSSEQGSRASEPLCQDGTRDSSDTHASFHSLPAQDNVTQRQKRSKKRLGFISSALKFLFSRTKQAMYGT